MNRKRKETKQPAQRVIPTGEKITPVYHPLHSFTVNYKLIETSYSPHSDILEIVVNKMRIANILLGNENTAPKLIEIK
jgi:hypothetical protein